LTTFLAICFEISREGQVPAAPFWALDDRSLGGLEVSYPCSLRRESKSFFFVAARLEGQGTGSLFSSAEEILFPLTTEGMMAAVF